MGGHRISKLHVDELSIGTVNRHTGTPAGVNSGSLFTSLDTSILDTYSPQVGQLFIEDFTITEAQVTLVDSGGATGGFLAVELAAPITSTFLILGGYLSVTVTAAGSNIEQDASIYFGVGVSEAVTGVLSGSMVSYLAANCEVALTDGAGSAVITGPSINVFVDGSSSDVLYFNIGVADADISDDDTVDFSAFIRLLLLDASKGA